MRHGDPLRDFLDDLERVGELLRVHDEVDPLYEISAFCRHVADMDGPALLFERIKGYHMPGLVNLFGTRRRIAMALGVEEGQMVRAIIDRLNTRISPQLVNRREAPCKEVVLIGEDVDLTVLPTPTWSVGDGGSYITAAVHIGKHPTFGKNAGIYRNMLRSRNEFFAQIATEHHQRLFYEDLGKGCPVALVIGPDPLLTLAAASDFGLGDYEVDVAGALRGSPLQVVRAETSELEVPADAEIVIEAEFTGKFDTEGPFNEFTGYQSEARNAPIWKVHAITHRRQPIMQMAYAAKPPNENVVFWREIEDAVALDMLQRRYPSLVGLTRPAKLARDFWGIVQVDPKRTKPGIVRNLLLATAFVMGRLKYIVAVDDDIDIYNLNDVLWAITTRVDPGRDVFIVPQTMTGPLDPSAYELGVTSKMFIDATRKPHFRGIPSLPPQDVLERVKPQLEALLADMTRPGPSRTDA